RAMHAIKQDAIKMKEALFKADFDTLAKILGKSWQSKKSFQKSLAMMNLKEFYKLAIDNGAYSGKTSGAGAGGIYCFVDPTKKYNLIKALSKEQ
ncbi:dehydrogenase, partial [Campylobacter jejuni]|nr:dehydrogenase [Campylobacter jejuni]